MLSVFMLSVILRSVVIVTLSVVTLSDVTLTLIISSVVTLSVITLRVVILGAIMLSAAVALCCCIPCQTKLVCFPPFRHVSSNKIFVRTLIERRTVKVDYLLHSQILGLT
jgi:hypothetical protein